MRGDCKQRITKLAREWLLPVVQRHIALADCKLLMKKHALGSQELGGKLALLKRAEPNKLLRKIPTNRRLPYIGISRYFFLLEILFRPGNSCFHNEVVPRPLSNSIERSPDEGKISEFFNKQK